MRLLVILSVIISLLPLKAHTNDYFIELNTIHKVQCGNWIGTGSLIVPNVILTANHVAIDGNCQVEGKPAKVIYRDITKDIALISVEFDYNFPLMPISCEGFNPHQEYFAIGYANGKQLVVTHHYNTNEFENKSPEKNYPFAIFHLATMINKVFHGMSGGPVINDDGYMVGIVNTTRNNSGGFRALSETQLCNDIFLFPVKPITSSAIRDVKNPLDNLQKTGINRPNDR